MTIKLTDNETALLVAIRDSEYNDETGLNEIWTNAVHGWSGTKRFSGVISSLTKKGLIVSGTNGEDFTIRITESAMALIGLGCGLTVLSKGYEPLLNQTPPTKAVVKVAKTFKVARAAKVKTETKQADKPASAILAPEAKSEPKLQIVMNTDDFIALHDFVSKSESPAARDLQTMLDQILLDLLRNNIKA